MDIKELNSFKVSDAITFHDHLNPRLFHGNRLQPAVEKQLKIKSFFSRISSLIRSEIIHEVSENTLSIDLEVAFTYLSIPSSLKLSTTGKVESRKVVSRFAF